MKPFQDRIRIVFLLLMIGATLFTPALAQDKPLLSDTIRKAIDSQGIEDAKKHFSEMDKSQREAYTVDMEAISELTNLYVQDGNFEAATAISEISAPFMQDMVSKSMEQYAPEMAEMGAGQQQTEEDQEREESNEGRNDQRQEESGNSPGEPHDDLERFTGLYANPEEDDSARQLWVQVSCEGYLVSGATWGDASPWWLQPESENVFATENSFNNIRIEFRTGAGGTLEMYHDLQFMETPLKRVDSLPDEWDPCLERMER